MNAAALARRRRRRRVPDSQRKRAPRAELMSSEESIQTPASVAASVPEVNTSKDSPEEHITINSHQTERTIWPRFLSRLREAFTLDEENQPEAQEIVAMQARITGPRTLQPWDLRRLQRAIDVFPPRPVADFLLYVCIHRGTDIFFFFDQGLLLSQIDDFYTDTQSPLRTDAGFISLALAVFALGSQFTSLEKPEGSHNRSPSEDGDPCTIFHRQIRTLIPDLIEMPSLYSIQALYIVGVYLMPLSALNSSYVYLGLALRKALEFDLHQCTDDPSLTDRENETRHRTWWSIYALERSDPVELITAVKLNRPRAIEPSIITVPLPKPFPPMDTEQKFDNVIQQAANARLAMILDRVIEIGNCTTQRARMTLYNQAEADLKEWKRSLPSHFKVFKVHPKEPSFRSIFHLYLNYYYAWIAMGKSYTVTVVRHHLRTRLGATSTLEADSDKPDESVYVLSSACIRAARKMLHLFESIATTGNMTRFSFTDFQGCSIATIVTILAGILERNSDYEASVGFGLSCLKKMSTGIVTAQIGVRFVEALQKIADEAVAKLYAAGQSPQPPLSVGTPATAADYNRWAQWLSRANHQSRGDSSSPPPRAEASSMPEPSDSMSPCDSVVERTNTWVPAQPMLTEPSLTATNSTEFPEAPLLQGFQTGEGLFPVGGFGDEQTFLMELTGMDVLDFSQL
ncbi:unnamed protein product [Clonostachys rosea]|uniref:Xylanolytic transcriptional activator regulatory domain-containing protein n=1 Tax=Bionectria ochroleuca TaxID=29856 RepID=A0ABY6UEB0_BIOOC|nr:unnamed protein product [Clonostachys rosea]